MSIIRAGLELVPVGDIRRIMRQDAQVLSTNVGDYCSANELAYYVLVNTWLHLISQASQYGWADVLRRILGGGLIPVIAECQSAATEFIEGKEVSSYMCKMLWHDVCQKRYSGAPIEADADYFSDPSRMFLQLLRYPKRFSPLRADRLTEDSKIAFASNQTRLKGLYNTMAFPYYIVWHVKEEMRSLINWDALCNDLEKVALEDIVFTPGVSFDTKSPLVLKLAGVAERAPEYFPRPFGIPLVAFRECREPDYYRLVKPIDLSVTSQRGDPLLPIEWREVHLVRPTAVPKSYKAARIIAAEDVVRQGYARAYFNVCDRYTEGKLLDLHDQTINQQLAKEGSISGSLSTIDLSAASDSVSTWLFEEVFPNRFVDCMRRVLPTHYDVGNGRRILHCCASMGNAMTFWIESMLFLGISRAAVRYFNLMTGAADVTVSSYGDDIIVPTDAALTVIEWLERLGFIINRDKSFFSKDILYRESCGEEYIKGYSLTSRYFPRFPIRGNMKTFENRFHRIGPDSQPVDSLSSLIDLQRKLFTVCVPAARLVEDVILSIAPKTTSSTPADDCNDIWSYVPIPKTVLAPGATKALAEAWNGDGPNPYIRELHSTVTRDKGNGPEGMQMLYSLYKYMHFLRFGPRYDDAFMELLGITSKPISYDQASTTASPVWRYRTV